MDSKVRRNLIKKRALRQKELKEVNRKNCPKKPLPSFCLDTKGPKNQGFIKIWLKYDSISLNKKRPKGNWLIKLTYGSRLLFVLTASFHHLSGANFYKADPDLCGSLGTPFIIMIPLKMAKKKKSLRIDKAKNYFQVRFRPFLQEIFRPESD